MAWSVWPVAPRKAEPIQDQQTKSSGWLWLLRRNLWTHTVLNQLTIESCISRFGINTTDLYLLIHQMVNASVHSSTPQHPNNNQWQLFSKNGYISTFTLYYTLLTPSSSSEAPQLFYIQGIGNSPRAMFTSAMIEMCNFLRSKTNFLIVTASSCPLPPPRLFSQNLRQFFSSLPSLQSGSPSHLHFLCMHSPELHCTSLDEHLLGGVGFPQRWGDSSDWSWQSTSSSHTWQGTSRL